MGGLCLGFLYMIAHFYDDRFMMIFDRIRLC